MTEAIDRLKALLLDYVKWQTAKGSQQSDTLKPYPAPQPRQPVQQGQPMDTAHLDNYPYRLLPRAKTPSKSIVELLGLTRDVPPPPPKSREEINRLAADIPRLLKEKERILPFRDYANLPKEPLGFFNADNYKGKPPQDIAKMIHLLAAYRNQHKDSAYFTTVADIESGGKADAESSAGCRGVMQFSPATGRQYGLVGDDFDYRDDPVKNIEAAMRYDKDNAAGFKRRTGRNPKHFDRYMSHQQGLTGWTTILDAVKTGQPVPRRILRNMKANYYGDKPLTPKNFVEHWKENFEARAERNGFKYKDGQIMDIAPKDRPENIEAKERERRRIERETPNSADSGLARLKRF